MCCQPELRLCPPVPGDLHPHRALRAKRRSLSSPEDHLLGKDDIQVSRAAQVWALGRPHIETRSRLRLAPRLKRRTYRQIDDAPQLEHFARDRVQRTVLRHDRVLAVLHDRRLLCGNGQFRWWLDPLVAALFAHGDSQLLVLVWSVQTADQMVGGFLEMRSWTGGDVPRPRHQTEESADDRLALHSQVGLKEIFAQAMHRVGRLVQSNRYRAAQRLEGSCAPDSIAV